MMQLEFPTYVGEIQGNRCLDKGSREEKSFISKTWAGFLPEMNLRGSKKIKIFEIKRGFLRVYKGVLMTKLTPNP
jgi:hypothetical protein